MLCDLNCDTYYTSVFFANVFPLHTALYALFAAKTRSSKAVLRYSWISTILPSDENVRNQAYLSRAKSALISG